MRKKYFIIIIFSFFYIISCHSLSLFADCIDLFHEILAENTKIKTIDARIVQHINTPDHSKEIFIGRYRADGKGRFRIDYKSPSEQIVVNNGEQLFWYYPDEKLLYQIGAGGMPSKPKVSPLAEFKGGTADNELKVLYLGEHLYGFFSFAHQFVIKDKGKGTSTDIWIDSKKKVVLSKVVRDGEGREIIKEVYEDYVKVNNIFIPSRVDIYARTLKGVTRNTTEYSEIKLNYKIPGSVFRIKFPKNIEKRYLNSY